MRNTECTVRKCGVRPSPRPRLLFLFYFIPIPHFPFEWGVDPEGCIMYKLYIISLPSQFRERTAGDRCFIFSHPEG
jgi:hypothetical protein